MVVTRAPLNDMLHVKPSEACAFTTPHGTEQALLAVGDGDLVALSLADGKATETAHIKLDSEIACLDLTPLGASASSLKLTRRSAASEVLQMLGLKQWS